MPEPVNANRLGIEEKTARHDSSRGMGGTYRSGVHYRIRTTPLARVGSSSTSIKYLLPEVLLLTHCISRLYLMVALVCAQ